MPKKKKNPRQLAFFLSLCISIFIVTISSFYIETIHAASESTNSTQFPAVRLQDIKVTQRPSIKKKTVMSGKPPVAGAILKPDLTCTIRAYHDQQRTRPIMGGVWRMSSSYYNPPLLPYPWYVEYDVEVKNIGYKNTDDFIVAVRFEWLDHAAPPATYYESVSLAPGEEIIYPCYVGPFYPGSEDMYNRSVQLRGFLDGGGLSGRGRIDESSETNNLCSYTVRFLAPSESTKPIKEGNTDRPGSDYRNFEIQDNNVNTCQKTCLEETKCRAWTFVKPGFQGREARCWLKHSVPNKIHSPCCISGVK